MKRRTIAIAFASGLLFGTGLVVSGMTDPAKVEGFLDLAGPWDPSLALVMAGAIAVGVVSFRLAAKRETTLLGTPMALPPLRAIDGRLVLGSVLFGVGWGLAGVCPGPGIVSIGAGSAWAILFTLAMLAGMALHRVLEAARLPRAPETRAVVSD